MCVAIGVENNQVWACVLGTLIVMVLALSFLSGFFRKWFDTWIHDSRAQEYWVINLNYTLYMLKILTLKGRLVLFYLVVVVYS